MPDDKRDLEIPEFLHGIPDDAPPATKDFMRAQALIQAAFHTYGDPRVERVSVGRDELYRVLGMALSILLATDKQLITPRDLRLGCDETGKDIADFARALREAGTKDIEGLLQIIGIDDSYVN